MLTLLLSQSGVPGALAASCSCMGALLGLTLMGHDILMDTYLN